MRVLRSVVRPVVATSVIHWRARRDLRVTRQAGIGREARQADRLVAPEVVSEGPLVSVLVPLWNFRSYVRECFESIVSQSYTSLEVVAIDDGTTDGTYDIARTFATQDQRIHLNRNEVNLGAFRNSLRCLELASGPIVTFVYADDVLHREAVARLVEGLLSSPEVVLSFAHFDLIGNDGTLLSDRAETIDRWPSGTPLSGIALGDGMLRRCRNWIGSPTAVAFRKSALADPTQLSGSEPGRQPNYDILWWIRILSCGKAVYNAETLSHTREHAASTTQSLGAQVKLLDAWHDVLVHARTLGFLADDEVEQEAWASYLMRMPLTLRRWQALRGVVRFAPALVYDALSACRKLDAIGRRMASQPGGCGRMTAKQ